MNIKDYLKNYYLNNKKQLRIKQKQYYEKNKKKILINCKKYVKNNKNKTKDYQYNYYLQHKVYLKKQMAIRQETHKEEKKLYDHKYKLKNYSKFYKKYINKLKTDLKFKLLVVLRIRLNKALRNNQKSGSTLKLVGCSIEFLKNHLESQFQSGMTWDNYGKGGWVIDHIKPCARFNLSKPSEQRKCFNYKNLQPLWEIDNLKKGDR